MTITIETRTYKVTTVHGRKKAGEGKRWLHPVDDTPFIVDWPMRFHGETKVVLSECV